MKIRKARGMEQAPGRNREDIMGMLEVHAAEAKAGIARTGAGQAENHSRYPASGT